MPVEIFLDASYAIALSCPSDAHHVQALTLARRLKREKARLVTTHAVVLEIGNALSKPRYRPAAINEYGRFIGNRKPDSAIPYFAGSQAPAWEPGLASSSLP